MSEIIVYPWGDLQPGEYPAILGKYLAQLPIVTGPHPDSRACAVEIDGKFRLIWDHTAGEPPTVDAVANYQPKTPVEALAETIQARLDSRQMERTGVRPSPMGAIPRTRALAAAAMSISGWGLPETLTEEGVPELLSALYADPASNTSKSTPAPAKKRAVQYLRIMAAGTDFGAKYSEAFTAYERTASPGIRDLIAADTSEWLDLPCAPWDSVRSMFLALLV